MSPAPPSSDHAARDVARDTVLVISGPDATAAAVMTELAQHPVRAVLLDIGEFPARMAFTAASTPTGVWRGGIRGVDGASGGHVEVELERVCSVYYRRPTRFSLPAGMSGSDAVLAEYEARLGLGGVLAALGCRWVCEPHAVARAEYKPLQLTMLTRAGLRVPRTLITNDHDAALQWAAALGRPVVCKQLSPVVLTDHGEVRITYTTPIDLQAVKPDMLAATAHCLQEQVTDKLFEARITMVGDAAFGVAIHTESDAAGVDWRSDYAALRYERYTPPADLVAGMRRYLHTAGLSYGCFDVVVTPDGVLVYECNPAGQYLWLEHATGVPISAAIAAYLAAPATPAPATTDTAAATVQATR
ncbi:MAG: hypothetical protein ACRDRK_07275 [Pseudonocardia sp.]